MADENELGDLKTPLPEVFVVKPEKSTRSILILIPVVAASLLALGFFISWSFGWVSFENYDPKDLSVMISDPRPEVRRMAATDWASRLVQESKKWDSSAEIPEQSEFNSLRPGLAETKVLLSSFSTFKTIESVDLKWGSSLIAILSFSKNPELVREPFVDFLLTARGDSKNELLFYTLMGLVRCGVDKSPKLQEDLAKALKELALSSDASVRKAVAFLSGELRSELNFDVQIYPLLLSLLSDSDADTRANAALSLLRSGKSEGANILEALMGEIDSLNSNKVPLKDLEKGLLILAALSQSPLPSHQQKIQLWADSHPNFKIRNAAKKAASKKLN